MSTHCQYCGDKLTFGHRSFGICAWCIKASDDRQKKLEKNKQPSYFNGDRDEYKGEVDYG